MLNNLISEIKKHLRISHTELDNEVKILIMAGVKDLELSGIASSSLPNLAQEDEEESVVIDNVDPLILRAIILYCKTNFGYDNLDFDKLSNSYQLLKMHLSTSQDYGTSTERSSD